MKFLKINENTKFFIFYFLFIVFFIYFGVTEGQKNSAKMFEEIERKSAVRNAADDTIKLKKWINEKKEELDRLEIKVKNLNDEEKEHAPYVKQKEEVIRMMMKFQEEAHNYWRELFISSFIGFVLGILASIIGAIIYTRIYKDNNGSKLIN